MRWITLKSISPIFTEFPAFLVLLSVSATLHLVLRTWRMSKTRETFTPTRFSTDNLSWTIFPVAKRTLKHCRCAARFMYCKCRRNTVIHQNRSTFSLVVTLEDYTEKLEEKEIIYRNWKEGKWGWQNINNLWPMSVEHHRKTVYREMEDIIHQDRNVRCFMEICVNGLLLT